MRAIRFPGVRAHGTGKLEGVIEPGIAAVYNGPRIVGVSLNANW